MTPEGCKRVEAAQRELEHAQSACATCLSDMVDEGGDLNAYRTQAHQYVRRWKDATESFLRAMCGR